MFVKENPDRKKKKKKKLEAVFWRSSVKNTFLKISFKNFSKFLRTGFLQNTSGGSFPKFSYLTSLQRFTDLNELTPEKDLLCDVMLQVFLGGDIPPKLCCQNIIFIFVVT